MKKRRQALLWSLFALYLLCLTLLLFQRRLQSVQSFNLVPLRTIRGYFRILGGDDAIAASFRPYAVTNFLGNLLAFLPLGIFLPLLFRQQRRFRVFLLTAAVAIALVELLQLLTRRGALDVDDLLLNLPGAILGWLLWRSAKQRKGALFRRCADGHSAGDGSPAGSDHLRGAEEQGPLFGADGLTAADEKAKKRL